MPINHFKAFKYSLILYLSFFWLSAIPYTNEIFITLNLNGKHPTTFWNILTNSNLIISYIILLSISSFGLLYSKLARFSALFNFVNYFSLIYFLPSFCTPPYLNYLGWILLWFVIFPHTEFLETKERLIWLWVFNLGYFVSGLNKLFVPIWQDGTVSNLLINSPVLRPIVYNILTSFNSLILLKIFAYIILLIELFAIFLIFTKITRKIIWWSLFIMHIMILITMNIPDISLLFLITLLGVYEDD